MTQLQAFGYADETRYGRDGRAGEVKTERGQKKEVTSPKWNIFCDMERTT